MVKLIVGVKGTGKTKSLIEMVNAAVESSKGSVVCIEKGTKLIHEITYHARLIDTDEYFVDDAQSLYGFVAGISASNHDVTHVFIDSALKICGDDLAAFEKFVQEVVEFDKTNDIEFVFTSSIPAEDLPASIAGLVK